MANLHIILITAWSLGLVISFGILAAHFLPGSQGGNWISLDFRYIGFILLLPFLVYFTLSSLLVFNFTPCSNDFKTYSLFFVITIVSIYLVRLTYYILEK